MREPSFDVAGVVADEAFLRALPKADLHCHLDGSLRLRTLLELADEQGVELPAGDEVSLAQTLKLGERQLSLHDYLRAFDVTLSVLQTEQALHRVAKELALDARAEGVRWLEVRFSPLLNQRAGLPLEAVVEAVAAGLAEAGPGIDSTILLCAMRHLDPATSLEVAKVAAAYAGRGVGGFDLAGDERNHPPGKHREAFAYAAAHGLFLTCHAGEAAGPESIAEALSVGASRIGHGVRLQEDLSLLRRVIESHVPLEICPSSNVQTAAVESYAAHPLRRFVETGVRVTLNTDNRLVSRTTMTAELLHAHRDCRLPLAALLDCVRNGFAHAFAPKSERNGRLREAEAEIERLLRVARDPAAD